ncbi:MAG: hypothetical protein ABIT92_04110 [Gammaproteobacteria bacterium]
MACCHVYDRFGNQRTIDIPIIVEDHAACVNRARRYYRRGHLAAGRDRTLSSSYGHHIADPAPAITYSHPWGRAIPLVTTLVTVIATDKSGNSSSGTFKVIVKDTTTQCPAQRESGHTCGRPTISW